AMLAFERHATSKLRDVKDLLSIATLGFRGEALPSIASVSRLLLETRSADDATGTRVEIAGGKMLHCDEAALTPGTSITVRDLFFPPPAVPPSEAIAAYAREPDEPASRIFRLTGFISRPQVQKANRNSIFTFVNGRLIRDRVLLHAISSAYHNLMPQACYPFALVFLECDCEEVDVNVHPSKTEVRFRHQSFVHDF